MDEAHVVATLYTLTMTMKNTVKHSVSTTYFSVDTVSLWQLLIYSDALHFKIDEA